MKNEAEFILETEEGDRRITIRRVNQPIHGGNQCPIGVFSLTEGANGLGEIVFDDQMNQWEYTGTGDLTHKQAEQAAIYIQNYKDEGR